MVVTVVAAVENAYFPLLFLPLFFVSHDTADSALDTGAVWNFNRPLMPLHLPPL
jgi:hypothetical protein